MNNQTIVAIRAAVQMADRAQLGGQATRAYLREMLDSIESGVVLPEEPTGLGAVVGVDGETWTLAIEGVPEPWVRASDGYCTKWLFIASRGAIIILSRGVTS